MSAGEVLVAFIESRLAEDEAVARATTGPDWRDDSAWLTDMLDPLPSQRREHPGYVPMITLEDIRHIARHDPARVLRDVEAKRRILARHQSGRYDEHFVYCLTCGSGEPYEYPTRWPCPELFDMASVWSAHPDYEQIESVHG